MKGAGALHEQHPRRFRVYGLQSGAGPPRRFRAFPHDMPSRAAPFDLRIHREPVRGRKVECEQRSFFGNDLLRLWPLRSFESSNKEAASGRLLVRPYPQVLVLCICCTTVFALHQQSRLSSGTQQCRLLQKSRLACVQLIQAQSGLSL